MDDGLVPELKKEINWGLPEVEPDTIAAFELEEKKLFLEKPADYHTSRQRYPLRSYGFGLRLNLFNFAILRWDYAVPLDQASKRGFWTWSLWPSF